MDNENLRIFYTLILLNNKKHRRKKSFLVHSGHSLFSSLCEHNLAFSPRDRAKQAGCNVLAPAPEIRNHPLRQGGELKDECVIWIVLPQIIT